MHNKTYIRTFLQNIKGGYWRGYPNLFDNSKQMDCIATWDKTIKSCRNCDQKTSCVHESAFIETSTILKVLFLESANPIETEKSFENIKKTMVVYTSHLCIGELFKKLSDRFKKELEFNNSNAIEMFRNLCYKAHWLLEGINILEVDADVVQQFNSILRENDYENRDRLLLSTAIGHSCKQFYTSDQNFFNHIKNKITSEVIKIKLF